MLPPALVAVAVTTYPEERTAVNVKEALPLRFVVTRFSPGKVSRAVDPPGALDPGEFSPGDQSPQGLGSGAPGFAGRRVKGPPSL